MAPESQCPILCLWSRPRIHIQLTSQIPGFSYWFLALGESVTCSQILAELFWGTGINTVCEFLKSAAFPLKFHPNRHQNLSNQPETKMTSVLRGFQGNQGQAISRYTAIELLKFYSTVKTGTEREESNKPACWPTSTMPSVKSGEKERLLSLSVRCILPFHRPPYISSSIAYCLLPQGGRMGSPPARFSFLPWKREVGGANNSPILRS